MVLSRTLTKGGDFKKYTGTAEAHRCQECGHVVLTVRLRHIGEDQKRLCKPCFDVLKGDKVLDTILQG